jgi:2-phosphosulfolactate phosphatase
VTDAPASRTNPLDGVDPRTQAQYQVRFGYGQAGVRELAEADLVVIADHLDAAAEHAAQAADPLDSGVVAAGLGDAAAVAARLLALQEERGARVSVAVIAAGRPDVSFSVEDVLAAGAIIEALADAGIDHSSPEAAAAGAAYSGLRHASGHLISASVTARILRSSGEVAPH